MHSADDASYRETREIKLGLRALSPPLDELAAWISREYGAAVLNLVCDRAGPNRVARIDIILEREADQRRMYADSYHYPEKRLAISRKYHGIFGLPEEEMIVSFSSFEEIAKVEANGSIPGEAFEPFYGRYGADGLWTVSRMYTTVDFFFYTDAQVRAAREGGIAESMKKDYWALLEPHNEFGYYTFETFEPGLDSKENLDRNYQGSWFLYYK